LRGHLQGFDSVSAEAGSALTEFKAYFFLAAFFLAFFFALAMLALHCRV